MVPRGEPVPPHLWWPAGAVLAHQLLLEADEDDPWMRAKVFEPAPPDEGAWPPVARWPTC
jgi:hypothetical protein